MRKNAIELVKSVFKSKKKEEIIKKRREFYSQFLTSKEDLYIDVGANYGNRIAPIIDKGFKIIAVEPQLKCVDFLKRKYGDKITIVPKGLGEKQEIKTMYISSAHTLSSFSQEWIKATKESGRFSKYKWNKRIDVEITTLDALIENFGHPTFIKIDVEGFELQVLKGLSHPVEYLSFEYTIPERKKSILDCIDRIAEISKTNTVLFNYSIGESMQWALEEWLTPKKMKEEVHKDRFIFSEFGDIYSKTTIK